MSKNFLNAFNGDNNNNINNNNNNNNNNIANVQLHKDFPTIFVQAITSAELNNLLENKDKKTSAIIRKLMSVLIPEDVWSKKTINYGTLKRDFPNEFGACFGK
jgi:hypothetical protein